MLRNPPRWVVKANKLFVAEGLKDFRKSKSETKPTQTYQKACQFWPLALCQVTPSVWPNWEPIRVLHIVGICRQSASASLCAQDRLFEFESTAWPPWHWILGSKIEVLTHAFEDTTQTVRMLNHLKHTKIKASLFSFMKSKLIRICNEFPKCDWHTLFSY